jgi:tetratricopeptide (TPR) repeat protein
MSAPSADRGVANEQGGQTDEPVRDLPGPLGVRNARVESKHPVLATVAVAALMVAVALGSGGAVCWQQEKQQRRTRIERQQRAAVRAEATLGQAAQLRKQMCWADANLLLLLARDAVDEADDVVLEGKFQQTALDLRLAWQVCEVREEAHASMLGEWCPERVRDRYPRIFEEYGLNILQDSIKLLAGRIGASAVREEVLAALDNWALYADGPEGHRLLELTIQIDPTSPWRKMLLEQGGLRDPAQRRALLAQLEPENIAPATTLLLYPLLGRGTPEGLRLLTQAHERHPNDFWLNLTLGNELSVDKENYVEARDRSRQEEAIGYYRAALAVKPNSAVVHTNLGTALAAKGEMEGAIRRYREAIRQGPTFAWAHYHLGLVLEDKGDIEGAIGSLREAIRLDSKLPHPHVGLGLAWTTYGDFTSARTSFEQAVKLLPATHPLTRYTLDQIARCSALREQERTLDAVLAGNHNPKCLAERVALAGIARLPAKQLYTTAVRLYTEAFQTEPILAEDLSAGHRYYAACAAARAGTVQGKDNAKFTDTERTQMRYTALSWLQSDVSAKERQFAANGAAAEQSCQALLHWQKDADLAAVRDPAALAKLPEAEQVAWRNLWARVDALLASVKPGK